MPLAVKENQPEVVAVWKIGQKLWTREYAAVYEALRSFNWTPQIQPLVAAFSGYFILNCLGIWFSVVYININVYIC